MSLCKEMDLKELSQYFHLPINEVSQQLGVCTTVLKKMCRSNGVERWPHRKIKSIDGLIDSLNTLIETEPEDIDHLLQEMEALQQKRELILANPNISYKSVVPKHFINNLNARIHRDCSLETTSRASTTSSPKKHSPLNTSPSKTIQKKSYRTRSKDSKRNVLITSQENLVINTLANIKHTREDVLAFNEFLENLKNLPVSQPQENETAHQSQMNEPTHQRHNTGLICLWGSVDTCYFTVDVIIYC